MTRECRIFSVSQRREQATSWIFFSASEKGSLLAKFYVTNIWDPSTNSSHTSHSLILPPSLT